MQIIDSAIRNALRMRKAPTHLADDAAREDMVRQIVAIVSKRAPDSGVDAWIGEVIERSLIKAKGHAWPSLDVWAYAVGASVATGTAAPTSELSATEYSFRSFCRRVHESGWVGEMELFGRFADRALREGQIGLAQLRKYQRAAFDQRAGFYGEVEAFKWLDEVGPAMAAELRNQRSAASGRDPSEPRGGASNV